MPKFLQALLVGLAWTLLALVLVFGGFAGYVHFAEHAASVKAADFCRAMVPGTSTAALRDSAISQGADARHTRWFPADGQDQLPVTFSGVTALSRHICWIRAEAGRVVSSELVYLD